ncbi:unnamed protein product [Protopolystoma xenopodis]|uniref:Uncharacterized protein n=1 Tax=Protopolystoma xenopodis TaxID=117903 RepID=A0A448X0W1_9PLAT|nr:unnamed protein product [Protopolystoma xenopodis]
MHNKDGRSNSSSCYLGWHKVARADKPTDNLMPPLPDSKAQFVSVRSASVHYSAFGPIVKAWRPQSKQCRRNRQMTYLRCLGHVNSGINKWVKCSTRLGYYPKSRHSVSLEIVESE